MRALVYNNMAAAVRSYSVRSCAYSLAIMYILRGISVTRGTGRAHVGPLKFKRKGEVTSWVFFPMRIVDGRSESAVEWRGVAFAKSTIPPEGA